LFVVVFLKDYVFCSFIDSFQPFMWSHYMSYALSISLTLYTHTCMYKTAQGFKYNYTWIPISTDKKYIQVKQQVYSSWIADVHHSFFMKISQFNNEH